MLLCLTIYSCVSFLHTELLMPSATPKYKVAKRTQTRGSPALPTSMNAANNFCFFLSFSVINLTPSGRTLADDLATSVEVGIIGSQLFLITSIMVCRRTSMKGTRRLKMSQMSMSFTYDVLGREFDTLMKRVTSTSKEVRFTVTIPSKSAG